MIAFGLYFFIVCLKYVTKLFPPCIFSIVYLYARLYMGLKLVLHKPQKLFLVNEYIALCPMPKRNDDDASLCSEPLNTLATIQLAAF